MLATWKGETHKCVALLHEQYGSMVRIAPDEVSFINPDAWKDIYGYGNKGALGGMPHKPWNRHGPSFGKYISPEHHLFYSAHMLTLRQTKVVRSSSQETPTTPACAAFSARPFRIAHSKSRNRSL
jgi:hypothetical protein